MGKLDSPLCFECLPFILRRLTSLSSLGFGGSRSLGLDWSRSLGLALSRSLAFAGLDGLSFLGAFLLGLGSLLSLLDFSVRREEEEE
jgi:hypothetical protein